MLNLLLEVGGQLRHPLVSLVLGLGHARGGLPLGFPAYLLDLLVRLTSHPHGFLGQVPGLLGHRHRALFLLARVICGRIGPLDQFLHRAAARPDGRASPIACRADLAFFRTPDAADPAAAVADPAAAVAVPDTCSAAEDAASAASAATPPAGRSAFDSSHAALTGRSVRPDLITCGKPRARAVLAILVSSH